LSNECVEVLHCVSPIAGAAWVELKDFGLEFFISLGRVGPEIFDRRLLVQTVSVSAVLARLGLEAAALARPEAAWAGLSRQQRTTTWLGLALAQAAAFDL
jgi:hypothetical protein